MPSVFQKKVFFHSFFEFYLFYIFMGPLCGGGGGGGVCVCVCVHISVNTAKVTELHMSLWCVTFNRPAQHSFLFHLATHHTHTYRP